MQQPKLAKPSPANRRKRRPNTRHHKHLPRAIKPIASKRLHPGRWLSIGCSILGLTIGCGAVGFAIARSIVSR